MMEADKFQALQLSSWRPRKAGGIIHWVWTFESQECYGQEKINILAQIMREKKTEFFLPLPFYSIQALNRLDVQPYWGGKLALLSPLILISSGDTITWKKKSV